MIGMETSGLEELKGFLSDVAHETRDGLKDRLRKAAAIVADKEKAETSSQRIRSEIRPTVEVSSLTDFVARIGPRGKWAFLGRFLESGTRPHAIPNFHGHDGVVFQHPGARAHPFLQPAKEATEDQVVELVGIPPMLRGVRSS